MRCCLQGLICTAPFGMKHPILGLAMHGLGRVLRVDYVPGLSPDRGSQAEDERGRCRHYYPPPLIESAARPCTHIETPPEDRAKHAAPDAAAPVIFRADNDARRVNKSHKSTQGKKGFARFDKEGRADKIHSRPAHVGENPQVWSHEKRP